jgi:hypothetical protein
MRAHCCIVNKGVKHISIILIDRLEILKKSVIFLCTGGGVSYALYISLLISKLGEGVSGTNKIHFVPRVGGGGGGG